jgi:GalNAc-alpha-(1->4)-GalNAc-alpha-(1->3)-diNAcBac-PP-undecaprenol alpha-1,4-N-acetyl-D-galactosaminyltransferase
MNLTLVIYSLFAGGAERVMSIMANYWAQKGWTITLLTFDDGTTPPFYALDRRVRHKPLGLAEESTNILQAIWRNVGRVLVLRREIAASCPDAVISFMDRTNVLVLLATLGMQVPVLVSERTNPLMNSPGRSWATLRNFLYPCADAIIVQTEHATTYFHHLSQVQVIPNPVINCAQNKTLHPLRLPKHSIVAMGQFKAAKRFDMLISAFASLGQHCSRWHLVILGDGELRSELEKLADELGITDQILLPGQVKKPHTVLAQASIFVLSSRFEGFPNALCEAMACGLAVIATDCPSGPREIIRDGVDGILVPNEDVNALASAMARLMADEDERRRLAARAPEITERFGLEKVMGMWETVLSQVSND